MRGGINRRPYIIINKLRMENNLTDSQIICKSIMSESSVTPELLRNAVDRVPPYFVIDEVFSSLLTSLS